MHARSVGGSIVLVIVVLVGIAMRYEHKSEAGSKMKAEVRAVLMHADGFAKNTDYFDSLLDVAHDEAFEAAYHMGYGRYQRSTLNTDLYVEKVFSLMIERANSEGATHIGAAIDKVYKEEVLDEPPAVTPKKK
jgi:hypothetical protein